MLYTLYFVQHVPVLNLLEQYKHKPRTGFVPEALFRTLLLPVVHTVDLMAARIRVQSKDNR